MQNAPKFMFTLKRLLKLLFLSKLEFREMNSFWIPVVELATRTSDKSLIQNYINLLSILIFCSLSKTLPSSPVESNVAKESLVLKQPVLFSVLLFVYLTVSCIYPWKHCLILKVSCIKMECILDLLWLKLLSDSHSN